MRDDDVLRLVADLESDRVERKESLANRDKVCEAICAFANDLPGHGRPGLVAIGVDDDGAPTGLPIDDRLRRQLADLRDNGRIHPFPSMAVDRLSPPGRRDRRGRDPAVDDASCPVPRTHDDPRRTTTSDRDSGGGDEAVRAQADGDPAVRRSSCRRHHPRRPGARALQLRAAPQLVAPDVLAADRRSIEHQLATVRFTDPSGIPTPTGLLFGSVSVESFGQPGVTDYRNPTIAGTLARLGYVQQFGVGIATARAALERNGNPPLELEASTNFVNVVLRLGG